jgi:hypothetical protein
MTHGLNKHKLLRLFKAKTNHIFQPMNKRKNVTLKTNIHRRVKPHLFSPRAIHKKCSIFS